MIERKGPKDRRGFNYGRRERLYDYEGPEKRSLQTYPDTGKSGRRAVPKTDRRDHSLYIPEPGYGDGDIEQ